MLQADIGTGRSGIAWNRRSRPTEVTVRAAFAVFLGIGEQRLAAFHVLCYTVHEAWAPSVVVTATQLYQMGAQVSSFFSTVQYVLYTEFYKELEKIIEELSESTSTIPLTDILQEMEFPNNWKSLKR